jgi:neural Wiskott-Aldrich syndrome protein
MQAVAGVDAGPVGRSQALDESLARAHQLAVAQGHAAVGLEHLLFALTDDPDGTAILDASNISIEKLRADVSGFVGRLSETMPASAGVAPQPGADLLRILQLAGMAARQSQRRMMDGAIVLAAIIGDGNSPAAGLLKAHGLTFEAVIRVLSQVGTPRQPELPPETKRQPLPPPPKTDPTPQAAPQSMADVQPAAPLPPQRPTRAPEQSTAEDMLVSVRARVKQAEPPTMPVRTVPIRPAPDPVMPPQRSADAPHQPALQTAVETALVAL